jgi:cytosine/adenosine deaminase-related metal-dependent hydrolase
MENRQETPMSTTLIDPIDTLLTMDVAGRELRHAAVLVRDNQIVAIGPSGTLGRADVTIDASRRLVMPGLVNTHHHLFQSLTRATPGAQDAALFGWLTTHYAIWRHITPAMITMSARLALAELALSGATTVADHLYMYPNGARIDDEIQAARELGIRFHPTRGAMSVGTSQGGLPPDEVVEAESAILRDTQRAIEAFHDPTPHSMCQIAVAPCAPFNVSENLMRESATLARSYGVRLHTHVAETLAEEQYTLERVGIKPVAYMASLGWMGPDVWWAHAVQLDADEIALMAETQTGVSHCPSSNMRLGSGIAPVRAYLDAGVPVGLSVDGSASNDSGHMLAEARQAMLLQRVGHGPGALSAREALWLATVGGAQVLGRQDIGHLAPGMSADLIAFDLDRHELAGAQADPVAGLVFCAPIGVDWSMINGRFVVSDGALIGWDLAQLVADHNQASRTLLART